MAETEYEIWLKKAEEDFETAKYNLEGNKIDAAVFYLQQSAEKSLKAVYIKKFKSLIKVHDLVLLSKKVKAPQNVINLCKELNPAYQYTRYPDVTPADDIEEKVIKFVDSVKEILKWARENI
jgi:HEPN domain-containing protein